MTVYVFDKDRHVRAPLSQNEVTDLVHDESNYALTAVISSETNVKTGEYIGFFCVDGKFRMFEVGKAAHDDDRNVTDITATDAIVADLKETVIEEKQQLDVRLGAALRELLPKEEWIIVGQEPDRVEKSRAYFSSAWTMIQTFQTLYEWRIIPFYRYEGGKIREKVLEMASDEAVFRGRILHSRKDASKVYLTRTGRPISRLYGLGPSTGSGDVQKNLTFADAVWSVEKGDPVDKPKGLTWVEDPVAVEEHGLHTDIISITDAENAEDLLQKTWDELQKRKEAAINVQATVADLEIVPGYSHQQIRLGDLLAVRLKNGEMVEARVIAIKRNYIRPWLTTITVGEKKADITSQVSSLITNAAHTFERLTIYQNRFRDDEALIQLNAEHIQLNATTIIEHAEQILLKAEKEELASVQLLLDGVNDQIIAMAGRIALQADAIALNAKELETKADTVRVDALVTEISGLVKVEELSAQVVKVVGESHFGRLSADMISAEGSVSAQNVRASRITTDTLNVGGTIFYPSDYATQEWVTENFSKASATYMPTVIERYGDVAEESIIHVQALNESGTVLLTGTVDAGDVYNTGWNQCRNNATSQRVLINYYTAGETLYDVDGNVATGPWYKGTEAYRYSLPAAKT